MSFVTISDTFDDLIEENKRLFNELLFAKNSLEVLLEFKSFVDLISKQFVNHLESEVWNKFEQLSEETNRVVSRKLDIESGVTTLAQILSKQTIDSSDNPFKTSSKPVTNNQRSNAPILNFTDDNSRKRYEDNNRDNGLLDMRSMIPIGGKYRCGRKGCNKQFTTKYQLQNHTKNHKSCHWPGCRYESSDPFSYRLHLSSHTTKSRQKSKNMSTERPIDNTSEIMATNGLKSENYNTKPKIRCTHNGCGKAFKDSISLKSHIRSVHSEKRFICKHRDCDYRTTRKQNLKSHMTSHTNGNTFTFTCNRNGCHKRFKSNEIFRLHMKTHESDNGSDATSEIKSRVLTKRNSAVPSYCDQFVCDYPRCDKLFPNMPAMKRHLKTHDAVKRFPCPVTGCRYQSTTAFNLRLHLTTHSSERSHPCEWPGCSKRYKTDMSLKVHIKSHLQESVRK